MRLSKWYMDGVADDGSLTICYAATLRWLAFGVGYSSVIELDPGGEPRVRSSLRRFEKPRAAEDGLSWRAEALDVTGAWQSRESSLGVQTLYRRGRGAVVWNCMQPRSRANVAAGERTVEGVGYAEHLAISMKPWALPIDELRWGRFHGPGETWVWIEWRGDHPLCWVSVNGDVHREAEITDDGVEVSGHRLSIADNVVLREGDLGSTILETVPILESIVPHRVRDMYEKKWLGRGRVEASGSDGWVIHEVVRWPGGES